MAKPFKELRAKMPADARKRADARANVLMQEMPLYELRQARQLSQEQLARELRKVCFGSAIFGAVCVSSLSRLS